MSQTFDELNAMWQAEVDELKHSVEESQKMIFALLEERSGKRIKALLEGQRTKDKVWVVVSDSHIMDAPCVNVCATEERAVALIYEMWDIWLNSFHDRAHAPSHMPATSDLEEPVEVHQGKMYTFEHHLVDWEYTEWHYVYEVEIDHD